MVATTKYNMK